MGKRKLTDQQKKRIQIIQERRIKKAEKVAEQAEQMFDESQLGMEEKGLVVARHGASVDVEDDNHKPHFCYIRQNIHNLVPGDRVLWRASETNNGIVTAHLPRNTVLERPNFHGYPKPIAANVTQMIIVFAPKPEPSADLINKYLVAAELLHIKPLIILNKKDLLPAKHLIHQWLTIYRTLNYPVIEASIKDESSVRQIQQELKNQTRFIRNA